MLDNINSELWLIILLSCIIFFVFIYLKQTINHNVQIELLRKRKNLGLKSQLKGDLAELIIPWLNESGCTGSELKHFGKPIDWIGFKGLDDPTAKIGIKIIEVKTGKTKNLSQNERRIKDAVERKDIEWMTIHIKQKDVEKHLDNIGLEKL